MLNAKSFVDLDRAVVATKRKRNGEGTFRIFCPFADFFGKIDRVGSEVELPTSHPKNVRRVEAGVHIAVSPVKRWRRMGKTGKRAATQVIISTDRSEQVFSRTPLSRKTAGTWPAVFHFHSPHLPPQGFSSSTVTLDKQTVKGGEAALLTRFIPRYRPLP